MPAYQQQPDQLRIVTKLAKDFHAPIGDVARLYARECATLVVGAHITQFLDIFATRRVRAILQARDALQDALPSALPTSVAIAPA